MRLPSHRISLLALLAVLATACARKDIVSLQTSSPIGTPMRICVIGQVTHAEGIEGTLTDGDTVRVTLTGGTIRLEGELIGLLFPGGEPSADYASIDSIDLSQCPNLAYFSCNGGSLAQVDLSHNPNLEFLALEDLPIAPPSLHANPALVDLRLRRCALPAIDLASNPNLKYLLLDGTHLTELDLSRCPSLELLSCAGSSLRQLNLTSLPLLKWLWCGQNDLSTLDLTANPLLELADCSRNRIRTLNLSGCPNLVELAVHTNIMAQEGMEQLVRSLPRREGQAGTFVPLLPEKVDEMNELGDAAQRLAQELGWRIATPAEATTVDALLGR